MQCIVVVSPLPTRSSSLPRQEHSTTIFQCWRYGSSTNPRWYRAAQAQLTVIVHKVTALDLIDYSTRMARRYQIHGILNIYVGFILDQLGTPSIGAWRLILPVQLRLTGLRLVLRASLLKGPRSHTPST
jgi:hypothetical protein